VRCEEFELWLSPYLDGELPARDVAQLEAHLAGCHGCTRELAALRAGVSLTRALVPDEPPADLRRRIMAAIDATRPSLWSRLAILLHAPALRPAVGLTAAGAVAVVGLVAVHQLGPTLLRTVPPPHATMLAQHPARAATRPSAAPAPATAEHPASRLAQVFKSFVPHTAPKSKPQTSPHSGEHAEPGLPSPADSSLVVARATPPAEEAPDGAPMEPQAPAKKVHSRRAAAHRWRPANGAARLAANPKLRSARSVGSPHGMTPAPPSPNDPFGTGAGPDSASGDAVSSTSANVTPDSSSDDGVTMMASMPMMPSGATLEPSQSADDELAALRQRLATQRRELPSISVDTRRHSPRATQPVIEF
jgi:hypothetical protein